MSCDNIFIKNPINKVVEADRFVACEQILPQGRLIILTQASGSTYQEDRPRLFRDTNWPKIHIQTVGDGLRFKIMNNNQSTAWHLCEHPNDFEGQINQALQDFERNRERRTVLKQQCMNNLHSFIGRHDLKDKSLKDYVLTSFFVGRERIFKLYEKVQEEIQERKSLMKMMQISSEFQREDVATLPRGSFAVQFDFALTEHWYSRDDTPLYPLENPVRKEWVFKVPEMGAAGWKGVFRQACRQVTNTLDNETIQRLFGDANDDTDENNQGGRLRFFPSFFDKIELCVINPHDRSTRAGTNPIYYETVPPGTRSRFTLLYVGADDHRADDRELVVQLIEEVFSRKGFGAKTGIGFGRAKVVKMAQEKKKKIHADARGGVKASGLAALGAPVKAKKTGQAQKVEEIPHNRLVMAGSMTPFNSFADLAKETEKMNREAAP